MTRADVLRRRAPQDARWRAVSLGQTVAARTMDLVRLCRPSHAVKTLFLVPLPLIDVGSWKPAAAAMVGWSVAAFVLASTAVYVGNDIVDRERDRHHPDKCHRPIAANRVPVLVGLLCCGMLLLALAAVIVLVPGLPYWPVLVYVALNVAYSGLLKHVPLIDLGVVAAGFVLRMVQGYLATGQPIDGWLLVTVFALSLLLIIGKRRRELLEAGVAHRPALRGYSVELANWLLQISAVFALVTGLMYLRTESPFGPDNRQAAMMLSTPFALLALFRYLQLQLLHGAGGDPVRVLLRDRVMVMVSATWAVALGMLLAFVNQSPPA